MTATPTESLQPDNDQLPMTGLEQGLEKLRGWHACRDGVPFDHTASALWRGGWLLRRSHDIEGRAVHLLPIGQAALGYART